MAERKNQAWAKWNEQRIDKADESVEGARCSQRFANVAAIGRLFDDRLFFAKCE